MPGSGKDWNNQQNIYHRWLKGETKTQREKFEADPSNSGNPSARAASPTLHLRYTERRALLAAQEALSTAIDAHDDAVQAVYRAHFSGGGSSDDSVIVH